VRVCDLGKGKRGATLTGHENWVYALDCITLDGTPAAVTASDDGTVRIWDLTIADRPALQGHHAEIASVVCNVVQGQSVAVTTSKDKTVRVWDLTTGKLRATLTGHKNWGNAVACTTHNGKPGAVT